jgi:hypothetical protein
MIIGFKGIKGSNSEKAVRVMADQIWIKKFFTITSNFKLTNKKIDLGVLAFKTITTCH